MSISEQTYKAIRANLEFYVRLLSQYDSDSSTLFDEELARILAVIAWLDAERKAAVHRDTEAHA